jgi:hypothetical protein
MPRRAMQPPLTPERQVEAERIRQALLDASAEDIQELAELLASKNDANIFGATEFAVRDIVLRVGAKAIQTALEGRKKGGTAVPPTPVPTAPSPPASSAGGPSPS